MNYEPNPAGPLLGLVIAMVVVCVYVVIFVGLYVLYAWLLSRVFRKAGIPAWKAWVPVYNLWVFLELGGQPGWIAILSVIPAAGIVATVFLCIAAYHIGLAFKKEGAWVVLYIFLPWLWIAIVGLDSSRWEPWLSPVPPVYGANIVPPMPPTSPGY